MNSIITTTPNELHCERTETIKECLNGAFIHGLSGEPYGAFPDLGLDTTIDQIREVSASMIDSHLAELGITIKQEKPQVYELMLNYGMYDLREYQRGLTVYIQSN